MLYVADLDEKREIASIRQHKPFKLLKWIYDWFIQQ